MGSSCLTRGKGPSSSSTFCPVSAMEVNNNTKDAIKEKMEALQICKAPKEAWTSLQDQQQSSIVSVNDAIYDPALLKSLPSVVEVTAKNDNLLVRPLQADDFDRGFIDLLKQLTSVGEVTENDFRERFQEMKTCKGTYYNTVIVDTNNDRVIGAASLIVERKFIHHCAKRGIIEEVIVSDLYRGKSLGRLIVKILIELGKSLGCYKITLNCTDKMIAFYQRLGFVAEQGNANFLVIRVPPTQTS